MICILISTVFWFLIKLSKEYKSDIIVNVRYENVPDHLVVVNKLPSELNFYVKGTGWQLFRNYVQFKRTEVIVDIANFGPLQSLQTNANHNFFKNQLPFDYTIERISPTEILFEMDDRSERDIPVILIGDIEINSQFGLRDSILLNPPKIRVSGPKSIVDTLSRIQTVEVQLDDLKSNTAGVVDLVMITEANLDYGQTQVRYEINLEQFTESVIELPVKIVNIDEETVVLISKSAELYFQLPIDRYEASKNPEFGENFELIADFNGITETDTTVGLTVTTFPHYTRNRQIKPKTIKFLFLKK